MNGGLCLSVVQNVSVKLDLSSKTVYKNILFTVGTTGSTGSAGATGF